ncbi:hypothetical protein GCM10009747_31470 [Agromyces humatus]|uniref:Uncharacterized protein n=1 Tax=Agromyces humatus TaxID=279573 RepID=A0ABP4X3F1_9MICO
MPSREQCIAAFAAHALRVATRIAQDDLDAVHDGARDLGPEIPPQPAAAASASSS